MIRVLLVDCQRVVRAGLSVIVGMQPDMGVAGEAADGETALALYRDLRPDVVTMDLKLPGMGGWGAIAAIRREFPDAKILVLTALMGDEHIFHALQAGALGYLPQESSSNDLVTAIRNTHAGKRTIPEAVTAALARRVSHIVTGGNSPANAIGGPDLVDAVSNCPQVLAGKYLRLANGSIVQAGDCVGRGRFAAVYRMPGGSNIIKISTNAAGSGPALQGQMSGAQILISIGINTPAIGSFQPADARNPGSLIASDFSRQWPGSYELSSSQFSKMSPADQNAVLAAMQSFANRLGNTGVVFLDSNPSNFALLPNGGSFIPIVIDPDMTVPVSQLSPLLANNILVNRIFEFIHKQAGVPCQPAQQPVNAQAFMSAVWLPVIAKKLRGGTGGR